MSGERQGCCIGERAILRAQIARDLAVRRAKQLEKPADFESASDAKHRVSLLKQYLKAAAELDKGNVPRWTPEGYLVESRSSLVGTVGFIEIFDPPEQMKVVSEKYGKLMTGEIGIWKEQDEPGLPPRVKLHFTVSGGDVFLYDPLLHKCRCEAGETGCWHGCSVEVWEMANELVMHEEDMPSEPPEPESVEYVDDATTPEETRFFVGAEEFGNETTTA